MTRRSARALLDARAKLHAIAAAAHAVSAAEATRAAGAVTDHERRLDASFVEASTSLGAARSVHDLDRAGHAIAASRGDLDDATKLHADAVVRTDATASALRERSRQLRIAERVLEQISREREGREARGEQRSQDDMAARRR